MGRKVALKKFFLRMIFAKPGRGFACARMYYQPLIATVAISMKKIFSNAGIVSNTYDVTTNIGFPHGDSGFWPVSGIDPKELVTPSVIGLRRVRLFVRLFPWCKTVFRMSLYFIT